MVVMTNTPKFYVESTVSSCIISAPLHVYEKMSGTGIK
jgi:hypothetical protein